MMEVSSRTQFIVVVVQQHLGSVIVRCLVHNDRATRSLLRVHLHRLLLIVSLRMEWSLLLLLVSHHLTHDHPVLINENARGLVFVGYMISLTG